MKALTAAEMRRADSAIVARIGIPSRAVMEVAGRAVAEFILAERSASESKAVTVVCGAGNNGGDGYVVARALACRGVPVRVVALRPVAELKGEAKSAAQGWHATAGSKVIEVAGEQKLSKAIVDQLKSSGFIVDAIFGTGFCGEVASREALLIEAINAASREGARIVSVDVPSGIDSTTGKVAAPCIKAQSTVSLQCPKLGQLLLPASEQCGALYVVDIGLDVPSAEIAGVSQELLSAASVQIMIEQRFVEKSALHKGSRGHLLVAGGSVGFYGAPKLSSLGGLVGGAGLATALLPAQGTKSEGSEYLEVICRGSVRSAGTCLDQLSVADFSAALEHKSAVVIGPGLGQEDDSAEFLLGAFKAVNDLGIPLVLDADALNLVARLTKMRALVPAGTVLTPHPGEMARLTGSSIAAVQADRLGTARALASELRAVVVLKGARTIIAAPDGYVWINPAATELLATAGSGDVLAGVIGGLLCRGYSSTEAACIGVFLHGVTGELLEYQGAFGSTATVIARAIPEAFRAVREYRRGSSDRVSYSRFQQVLPGSLPRWSRC